jgi:hypothetical protein
VMFSCHEKQTAHPKWKVRQRTTAAGELPEHIQILKGKLCYQPF